MVVGTMTPCKVALLRLVCGYAEGEFPPPVLQHLAVQIVSLLEKAEETPFSELCASLMDVGNGVVVQTLQDELGCIETVDYVFQLVNRAQSHVEDGVAGGAPRISVNSLFGLYIRACVVQFTEMHFQQVARLFELLAEYQNGSTHTNVVGSCETPTNRAVHSAVANGELLTAMDALHTRPTRADGSLWSAAQTSRAPPNAQSRKARASFHYESLALAGVHFRFGHTEEGLKALDETVRIAQESGDSTCIQYALAWIAHLDENGLTQDALSAAARLAARSLEFDLPSLHSLALLVQAERETGALVDGSRHDAHDQHAPKNSHVHSAVAGFVEKAGDAAFRNAIRDVRPSAHVISTAAWGSWGCAGLEAVYPELVNIFHSTCAKSEDIVFVKAATAFSAALFPDKSREADVTLPECDGQFDVPVTPEWSAWVDVSHAIVAAKFAADGDVDAALCAASGIRCALERAAITAEAAINSGDCALARSLLAAVDPRNGGGRTTAASLRVLVLLAASSIHGGQPELAVAPLLGLASAAQARGWSRICTEAILYLGEAQLALGWSDICRETVESALPSILANGGLLLAARAKQLYGRALVSCAQGEGCATAGGRALLHASTDVLSDAARLFGRAECERRAADCLRHLAEAHNALGNESVRNIVAAARQDLHLDTVSATL